MSRIQLGYLGFEVSDIPAWESFATDVLGLGVTADEKTGGLRLRMDSHTQRFFITPGPADDLACIGWQVDSDETLDTLTQQLSDAGCDVTPGTEETASARGVRRLMHFEDPAGIASELFVDPKKSAGAFESPKVASGFVADTLGMGHVVVTANDKSESNRFYTELLGLNLSDTIVCEYYGHDIDMSFYHVPSGDNAPARHHSIAFGGPQPKRINHFMLEVGTMDDVGLCFDRAIRHGCRIVQTLGRHPNDKMFSFYAKTPSGFQFEFGWGGQMVDDATWSSSTHDCLSEWGHHPPGVIAPRKPRT